MVAQLPPPKQREMPSVSTRQTDFWPSQQSCRAPGALAPQMSPTGSQPVPPLAPFGFVQRPTGGFWLTRLQVTWPVGPPQQSSVEVQRSPPRRQPDAEAHTVTPLPGSAQTRLQHCVPVGLHGSPSRTQPGAPGAEAVWQSPGPPPLAEQRPEQQSEPAKQMSPSALQTHARTQMPPWQFEEQHWPPLVQALPSVVQLPPSDAHWPLTQLSVQQEEAAAQAPPTLVQPPPAQSPPTQALEQQSVGFWQATPAGKQRVGAAQAEPPPSSASQTPEQQGEPPGVQPVPVARHVGPPPVELPPVVPAPVERPPVVVPVVAPAPLLPPLVEPPPPSGSTQTLPEPHTSPLPQPPSAGQGAPTLGFEQLQPKPSQPSRAVASASLPVMGVLLGSWRRGPRHDATDPADRDFRRAANRARVAGSFKKGERRMQPVRHLIPVLALACVSLACSSPVTPVGNYACTGSCSCTDAGVCSCAGGATCSLGPAADGGADAGLPSNVSLQCQQGNTCSLACGSNCAATCAAQTTCAGSCGTGCNYSCSGQSSCGGGDAGVVSVGTNSTVSCTGGSGCTLAAGSGSTVTCGGTSSCTLTLEPGASASCTGTSTCDVVCAPADGGVDAGACGLSCDGNSHCRCIGHCDLTCQGGAATECDAGVWACTKGAGGC